MKTYYVRLTKDMGRGVFADRDFKSGEVITMCEILVLDKEDTVRVNSDTKLNNYTFKYNDEQDCLVLGDGSIFNHSDSANVRYELKTITDSIGTRTLMMFVATKPIIQDEQMFIDYNQDTDVDIKNYKFNLVG